MSTSTSPSPASSSPPVGTPRPPRCCTASPPPPKPAAGTGSTIEAQLLLALAHDAGGDRGQALDVLADALTRAEPERFVRMFLDAGAPMTALLQAAVRQDRTAHLASALLAAGTVAGRCRHRRGSSTS